MVLTVQKVTQLLLKRTWSIALNKKFAHWKLPRRWDYHYLCKHEKSTKSSSDTACRKQQGKPWAFIDCWGDHLHVAWSFKCETFSSIEVIRPCLHPQWFDWSNFKPQVCNFPKTIHPCLHPQWFDWSNFKLQVCNFPKTSQWAWIAVWHSLPFFVIYSWYSVRMYMCKGYLP